MKTVFSVKHNLALAALLCLLALLMLLPCAAAEGKEALDSLWVEPEFFGKTWYATDDLPEGVEANGETEMVPLGLWKEGDAEGSYEEKKPQEWALELVSGNSALEAAVRIRESADGAVMLEMDPGMLTVPGEAVFRLTLENEKYTYSREHTLRVESFRSRPPFAVSEVPLTGYIGVGDRISSAENLFSFFLSQAQLTGNVGEAKFETADVAGLLDGVPGFRPDGQGAYVIPEEGVYDFTLPVSYRNVKFEVKCRMIATQDRIEGAITAAPGESLPFSVQSERKTEYTWSVKGEGASIREDGLLTVDPDTPVNTLLLVEATPADGGIALSHTVFVMEFGFASAQMENIIAYNGLEVPVLSGKNWTIRKGSENLARVSTTVDSSGLANQSSVYFYTFRQFVHDDASAEDFYREVTSGMEDMESEVRMIRIEDWPAALQLMRMRQNGLDAHVGTISYIRNNTCTQVVLMVGRTNAALEDGERITFDLLEEVASHIHYDESKASITYKDVSLTVETATGAAPAVTAGKKLQLKASFGNQGFINSRNKNNGILWSISDPVGGETAAAKIDSKGVVTAARSLEAPVTLLVKATSEYFMTETTYEITVIPAATAVVAEPAEINLYEGSGKTETVKAAVSPETVPVNVLGWKLAKEGIAEMTAGEDGTAVFRALQAGKTTVTVTEPGGRKATVKVNVFVPVEDVELSMSGKQVPGGTVTVKAAVAPKNAGKKDLEWSVDVGEDIATVNNRGQVKIAKTAPAGTVITVTCKATGAPEPVVRTLSFEVNE